MAASRYRHAHAPLSGEQARIHRMSTPARGKVNTDFAAAVAAAKAREAAEKAAAGAPKPTPNAEQVIANRKLAAIADRRAAQTRQARFGAKTVTVEWAATELGITTKTARAYARAGKLELTELSVRTYAVTRIKNAIRTGTTGWLAAPAPAAQPEIVVTVTYAHAA